jgi:hypothetical protein
MGIRAFRGPHALLAIAVGAMVVLPIAFAGADAPEATTSAGPKKQIKALKQRVSALEGLRQRVAALEGRETLPPSGPAGGDLAGSYPAPQVGANAIGSPELALDSVGSSELKGVTAVIGEGVEIESGETAEATVTCPPGSMVVGGGFEWVLPPSGAIIRYSSPSFVGDSNTTWVVRGQVFAPGGDNTLHAEANCLAV